MKNIQLIILICVLIISCGENTGDGRESGTDKHEWSILQNHEFKNREVSNLKFSILEENGYSIVQVPNKSGVGATYILLNPKAPPFYKQLPIKQFNLSKEQFRQIQMNKNTITTVETAINSHVVD